MKIYMNTFFFKSVFKLRKIEKKYYYTGCKLIILHFLSVNSGKSTFYLNNYGYMLMLIL